MKANKWLSLSLAVGLNLGGWLTTPSLAADAAAPASGRFFQRMAQRLMLTDDQKARIKTVLRAEKATLTPLPGQLRAARKNLRATIRASDANETSVRAASARVAEAEADLAVERMKIYGKIAPILTEEQRRQISDGERHADVLADRAIARAGERSGD